MIVLDCEQGSPAWVTARLGIPTASGFGNLITPKTGKPSASATRYRNRLLAEWLLGEPLDAATSDWMARGKEMEDEARAWYEFQHDVDVVWVGFVLRDDGLAGCSPDGFVGEDGILEIKIPSAEAHIGYIVDGGLADDYRAQVQGELWLCERAWVDLVSFNPAMPPVEVRCERDERFIVALASCVTAFAEALAEAKQKYGGERAKQSEGTS